MAKKLIVTVIILSILIISGCAKTEISQKKEPLLEILEENKINTYLQKILKDISTTINYSWKLTKSDEGATLSTPSELPRIAVKSLELKTFGSFTPLVEGEKIFLADRGGKVYAINDYTGEVIWGVEVYDDRTNLGPKWKALGLFRFVTAYGLGNHLYVGTSSTPSGEKSGFLIAFDKNTGKIIWKVPLEAEDKTTSDLSVSSNLLVVNEKILLGSSSPDGYVFCFNNNGKLLWKDKIGGIVRGLAYGDGIVYAVSEPKTEIHAFDVETGKKIWVYKHENMLSTPIFKNGKLILIDSSGNLLILSSEGKLLLKKFLGLGGDVNSNSYLACGDYIYTPRTLGERPLNLYVIDFNGNIIGEFKLEENENAGAPVISRKMVLLPVVGKDYSKIYFLWNGIHKIDEYKFKCEETYMPKLCVAYGKIYTIFNYDRANRILIKFEDKEKPEILKVEEIKQNGNIEIKVLAKDNQSGINRVLVFYKKDSDWDYKEMELARKYFIEPIGGYGFNEEEYNVKIPDVEYLIIVIDNIGNFTIYQK